MDEDKVRQIIREELAAFMRHMALAWDEASCGNTGTAPDELRRSLARQLYHRAQFIGSPRTGGVGGAGNGGDQVVTLEKDYWLSLRDNVTARHLSVIGGISWFGIAFVLIWVGNWLIVPLLIPAAITLAAGYAGPSKREGAP